MSVENLKRVFSRLNCHDVCCRGALRVDWPYGASDALACFISREELSATYRSGRRRGFLQIESFAEQLAEFGNVSPIGGGVQECGKNWGEYGGVEGCENVRMRVRIRDACDARQRGIEDVKNTTPP